MKLNKKIKILWIDDEIDLLQSHIFFLKAKGYLVDTALDGLSALEMISDNNYDLVFLDETNLNFLFSSIIQKLLSFLLLLHFVQL